GTPSILTANQIKRQLTEDRRSLQIEPSTEWTVEANPRTLTTEKLATLREHGCNRLSLGVQAVQPEILRALGRDHDWRDVLDSVRSARAAGFDNLSVDIMFGLPGQSLADWRETADRVLDLEGAAPQHISVY